MNRPEAITLISLMYVNVNVRAKLEVKAIIERESCFSAFADWRLTYCADLTRPGEAD